MKVFIGLIVTVQLLTSTVFCNTECEEDSDVADINKPQYFEYTQDRSYRFYPTIISASTNCHSVIFPLHDLKRKYCKNCTTTLKILSLANTTLPVLPKDAIPEVPDYNTFILSDLNISKIYPGAFSTQAFQKIVLSHNKLTEIELGTFNSLTKLQNIDLSFNNLKSLPIHCFMGIPHLKTLNVSHNEINKFSFDILDVSVTKIDLLDLSFTKINDLILDDKIHIDKLYLSNNQFKTFKFCPFSFTELNLSHNVLEFLPENPCDGDTKRNNLKVFDVSFNKISKLDHLYFQNATNLEYLYLNHNNISVIPTGLFFNLSNLIFLNMSENHLKEFEHGTFDSLRHLRVLDLSYNNIKIIKTALHALYDLNELYLQNNYITSIDTQQLLYNGLRKVSFINNNFSCDNLVQIFSYLKTSVHFTKGNNRNTSNIHGIACSDTPNFELSEHKHFENVKNDVENIMYSLFKEKINKRADDINEHSNKNNAEHEQLVDQKFEYRNVTRSANVILIILGCIACLLISVSNYLICKVLKNKSNRIPDEVELLQG